MDEPQILLAKKQKQELELPEEEKTAGAAYIPYKVEPEKDDISELTGAIYGYPEEWNHSIGMNYELRARREAAISSITAKDILEKYQHTIGCMWIFYKLMVEKCLKV